MRVRALLAAATVVGGTLLLAQAPSASAYCDPDYYPLCVNDCTMQPPPTDPKQLDEWLIRVCPA